MKKKIKSRPVIKRSALTRRSRPAKKRTPPLSRPAPSKKKKKAGPGRPSDYPEYSNFYRNQAKYLSSIGLSQKDMAGLWNKEPDTITKWKQDFPDFAEALIEGESKKKKALLLAMWRNAVLKHNPTIQIFLAKNFLGMKDKFETSFDAESAPLKVTIVPAEQFLKKP
jgi:hypothetical protein